ncbi:MAG: hypothetical protein Q7Q73_10445 [Verrucomicrobiota bacterium JB024]|nr:hypothetical protein [Verrucomicrobiota bacterium JB024]
MKPLVFILVSFCCLRGILWAEVFPLSHEFCVSQLGNGEEDYTYRVDISQNVYLPATIQVTSKGNGVLYLSNLALRIIDGHYDGAVFDKDRLTVEVVDLNQDGFGDLFAFGSVLYSLEEDDFGDGPTFRENVVFIYYYQPKTGEFIEGPSFASFKLSPDQGPTYSKYYLNRDIILGFAQTHDGYGP